MVDSKWWVSSQLFIDLSTPETSDWKRNNKQERMNGHAWLQTHRGMQCGWNGNKVTEVLTKITGTLPLKQF